MIPRKTTKPKTKIKLPEDATSEPAKRIRESVMQLQNPSRAKQFENFVVEMLFSREGIKLYELSKKTSKYHNRELDVKDKTNIEPDLLILFKKSQKQFAIECRYHAVRWYDEETRKPFIDWCKEDEWVNYLDFQKTRRIPVFVVIGIGGTPDKPHEVYCIPLKKIRSRFLFDKDLNRFAKGDRRYFRLYWDDEKKNLGWDRPERAKKAEQ